MEGSAEKPVPKLKRQLAFCVDHLRVCSLSGDPVLEVPSAPVPQYRPVRSTQRVSTYNITAMERVIKHTAVAHRLASMKPMELKSRLALVPPELYAGLDMRDIAQRVKEMDIARALSSTGK